MYFVNLANIWNSRCKWCWWYRRGISRTNVGINSSKGPSTERNVVVSPARISASHLLFNEPAAATTYQSIFDEQISFDCQKSGLRSDKQSKTVCQTRNYL
jgi:hypothetical protein